MYELKAYQNKVHFGKGRKPQTTISGWSLLATVTPIFKFSVNDSMPNALSSQGKVYEFTCVGCTACYVGETRHFGSKFR